jgi:hypothetical protein
LEDIEEDVQADMPNVFVMAAVQDVYYNSIKTSTDDKIRNIVLERSVSSRASTIRLIKVKSRVSQVKLAFLKSLSNHYADTLRERISSQ